MVKHGVDNSGARRLESRRAKRDLNRERGAEQEERSIVRRAGWSGVECRKKYITIRVNRSKKIRENKSEIKQR